MEKLDLDELKKSGFSKEQINRLKDINALYTDINNNLTSLVKSNKLLNDTQKLGYDILKRVTALDKEINKQKKNEKSLDKELIKNLENKKKILEEEFKKLKEINKVVREQQSFIKSLTGSFKDLKEKGSEKFINFTKKGFKDLQYGIIKLNNEYISFSRNIRNSASNIGLNNKQANILRKTFIDLNRDGYFTKLGYSLDDILKTQELYTDNLGRNILLNEQQINSLVEIDKGLGIGVDRTSKLVSDMEAFGFQTQRTRNFLNDNVSELQKLGLNSKIFTQTFENNIKKAQGFNFKNGIKGLTEIIKKLQPLKGNLNSILNLSENLFNPEAAIELSANLQVLGGSFSKLADPFQLMFQARNDVEGLANSIVEATKNVAQFDEKSKQFKIPAMELQRLRLVAEQLNYPFEDLTENILQSAKQTKALSQINPFEKFKILKDPDSLELLKNITSINEKGVVQINLGEGLQDLKNVSYDMIKEYQKGTKELKDLAETRLTIIDRFRNSFLSFERSLFPLFNKFNEKVFNDDFFQKIDEMIYQPVSKFINNLRLDNILDTTGKFVSFITGESFKKFINVIGDFGGRVIKLIETYPKTMAAFFIAQKSGLGNVLFDSVQYFIMGKRLRAGFESAGSINSSAGYFGKGGKGRKGLKTFGKGLGFGAALSGLSYGINEFGPNNRTTNILSSTLDGAGTGAMVGSLFGPYGTAIGGVIGGLGGLFKSLTDEQDNLPGYAKGAIVKSPITANIAENGPEIVSPISDLKKYVKEALNEQNIVKPIKDFNINLNIKFDTLKVDAGDVSIDMKEQILNDSSFQRILGLKIKNSIISAQQGGASNFIFG